MARSFSLIAILGLVAIVAAKKQKSAEGEVAGASCAKQDSQIATLEKHLEESKSKAEKDVAKLVDELNDARKVQCEPFSVVDPVMNAYRFVVDAGTHLLERTSLDEDALVKLTLAYDHAKQLSVQVIDKVSSVDYAKHIQDMQSHDIYLTQIAPHVEKAHLQLKPHLDEHVYPNIEKVKIQVGPHFESAQAFSVTLFKRVKDEVMPVLKEASSKVMDIMYDLPLEKAITPIFDAAEKIAPNQAHALPKKTFDRAFVLILTLYVLYKSFSWGRKVMRVAFFFVRIFFKLFRFAFRLCVLLPVKIVFKVLRICLCIGTCFHCCCLCRRKSKVGDLKAKAGNKDDVKDAPAGVPATVAEVQQLLETCKKEKKSLDDAAKQLAKFVKNGKQMEKPDKMKGKTLSKDIVLKACAKFKEIDVKKLSL